MAYVVENLPCVVCHEEVTIQVPVHDNVVGEVACQYCTRAAGHLLRHPEMEAVSVALVQMPGGKPTYFPVEKGSTLEGKLKETGCDSLHRAVFSTEGPLQVLAPEEEEVKDDESADILLRGQLGTIHRQGIPFHFTREHLDNPVIKDLLTKYYTSRPNDYDVEEQA